MCCRSMPLPDCGNFRGKLKICNLRELWRRLEQIPLKLCSFIVYSDITWTIQKKLSETVK